MHTHSNDGEAILNGVPVTALSGIYWGPLAPFEAKDAHDELLKTIEGRVGAELMTATVYDRKSGAKCGRYDVAVDASSGDGCGMYRSIMLEPSTGEIHDLATPPLWYQYKDPQDVVAKVHKFLVDMKFFENLDAFVYHVLTRAEAEAKGQVH
ncbi:hypothetical protein ACCS92_08930 [Rhizobium ruizarguesonis]|jgi:hypothetical protein|uniref:hypothetical protein n=1 Tax=Rhizobium leguminosarum TaxID=384 RepID=UPI0004A40767|nr:hypothetical protein [Rhizobium leguminosarum]TAV76216.1 hypothetical protein ELI28_22945 [Rhizobium leguminosarum]TAV80815.1 hypothetical protein ELI27_22930 [Rhizobium leguminosarum]TAX37055.1 hypothetical protein ELI06_23280 [Rhizobium leguminosarum]TAZ32541.1 hypothetical protein ELH73_22935 [Rhizobium leguminosarum]